jgi:hypothetical protein
VVGHEGVGAQHVLDRAAEGTRALAVDDTDRSEAGQEGIVEVLF